MKTLVRSLGLSISILAVSGVVLASETDIKEAKLCEVVLDDVSPAAMLARVAQEQRLAREAAQEEMAQTLAGQVAEALANYSVGQFERRHIAATLEQMAAIALPKSELLSGTRVKDIVKLTEVKNTDLKKGFEQLEIVAKLVKNGNKDKPGFIMKWFKAAEEAISPEDIETRLQTAVQDTATSASELSGQIDQLREMIGDQLGGIEELKHHNGVARKLIEKLREMAAGMPGDDPKRRHLEQRVIPDILADMEGTEILIADRLGQAQVYTQIADNFGHVVRRTSIELKTKPSKLLTALIQLRLTGRADDILQMGKAVSDAAASAAQAAAASNLELKQNLVALEQQGFDDPAKSKRTIEIIAQTNRLEAAHAAGRAALLERRVNTYRAQNEQRHRALLESSAHSQALEGIQALEGGQALQIRITDGRETSGGDKPK